jgi:hypothetical protein
MKQGMIRRRIAEAVGKELRHLEAEPKQSSGVGRRSRRYGDVMRRTRGNGWRATRKDAAMNEHRKQLRRRIAGAIGKKLRHPEAEPKRVEFQWRWMKSRSSGVNRSGRNESRIERERGNTQ